MLIAIAFVYIFLTFEKQLNGQKEPHAFITWPFLLVWGESPAYLAKNSSSSSLFLGCLFGPIDDSTICPSDTPTSQHPVLASSLSLDPMCLVWG